MIRVYDIAREDADKLHYHTNVVVPRTSMTYDDAAKTATFERPRSQKLQPTIQNYVTKFHANSAVVKTNK